jgi:hypothetical protein
MNVQDPARKITAFKEIVASIATAKNPGFREGEPGHIAESSTYFQWLTVSRD